MLYRFLDRVGKTMRLVRLHLIALVSQLLRALRQIGSVNTIWVGVVGGVGGAVAATSRCNNRSYCSSSGKKRSATEETCLPSLVRHCFATPTCPPTHWLCLHDLGN